MKNVKNIFKAICVVMLVAVTAKLMARFPPVDAPQTITIKK